MFLENIFRDYLKRPLRIRYNESRKSKFDYKNNNPNDQRTLRKSANAGLISYGIEQDETSISWELMNQMMINSIPTN